MAFYANNFNDIYKSNFVLMKLKDFAVLIELIKQLNS